MRRAVIWLSAFISVHGYIVEGLSTSDCSAGCSAGSAMLQASFSSRQGEPLSFTQEKDSLEVQPAAATTSQTAVSVGLIDHADAGLHSNGSSSAVQLQTVHSIHSNRGQCLKFLHIPKNAGTTIEGFSVKLKESGIQGAWGMKDQDLNCTNVVGAPEGWNLEWGPAIACGIHDEAGRKGNCSVWHTPPAFDPKVAASYAQPGCETFCVVRDPMARLWSQHLYEAWIWNISYPEPGACSADAFSGYLMHKMLELAVKPFSSDCHFVPQLQYTQYGRFCQHIIKFDNLEQEFNALMADHGIPLTLDNKMHAMQSPFSKKNCSMKEHLDKIPANVIKWVEEYYKEDYAAFGFGKVA